jgi:UDP-galactopyranose mutase
MPFALNESTRYISPTKTPEYLAGGKPVISTAVSDVVDPYGALGLVNIIASPNEFINAAEYLLGEGWDKSKWLKETDEFLSHISWDITFNTMLHIINQSLEHRNSITDKNGLYV